jgi:spermidine synthase
MAEGLTHPKSTVHVGDGFKFLDEYKNAFDVIITDSSDPDGPAESLFQKSYFQLLHDALREGGVITTQGCMSHFFLMESRGVPRQKAVCEKRNACIRADTPAWSCSLSFGIQQQPMGGHTRQKVLPLLDTLSSLT